MPPITGLMSARTNKPAPSCEHMIRSNQNVAKQSKTIAIKKAKLHRPAQQTLITDTLVSGQQDSFGTSLDTERWLEHMAQSPPSPVLRRKRLMRGTLRRRNPSQFHEDAAANQVNGSNTSTPLLILKDNDETTLTPTTEAHDASLVERNADELHSATHESNVDTVYARRRRLDRISLSSNSSNTGHHAPDCEHCTYNRIVQSPHRVGIG
jgi:hypothetical protein